MSQPHESEKSTANGTARENSKYLLKIKYYITGALRNGNGKWEHATCTIWFESSQPYFAMIM